MRVTNHYVVKPATAIIRERLAIKSSSGKPIHLGHLDFLRSRVLGSIAQDLQFNYITGGGNYNGSQLLKTENMLPPYRRILDSDGGIQPGNYSSYLPLVFLLDGKATEGLAFGWDYLGHWRFEIGGYQ